MSTAPQTPPAHAGGVRPVEPAGAEGPAGPPAAAGTARPTPPAAAGRGSATALRPPRRRGLRLASAIPEFVDAGPEPTATRGAAAARAAARDGAGSVTANRRGTPPPGTGPAAHPTAQPAARPTNRTNPRADHRGDNRPDPLAAALGGELPAGERTAPPGTPPQGRRRPPSARATVLGSILPPTVRTAELFDDNPGGTLFPDEDHLVALAGEVRRRQFAAGRLCARRALVRLGIPPAPLLRTPHGAARWPQGVCGSITHARTYRAAAVARTRDILALGIDVEPHRPLKDGQLPSIAAPGERTHLAELRRHQPAIDWDRLLLCVKQAAYKTWSPLTGRRLGHDEAVVDIDPDHGSFTVRVRTAPALVEGRPLTTLPGRWTTRHGLLFAAVTVPAVGFH
ncbi:4'-phosphopantetheinyl transferase superfamily protein [Yinghuangia seranimata]|uniref:4'-phosphopantetheinyl transferase superfamily protein n=1 Tax=Yinghuangia seranimata TaxID=408067 RepID=UPI00248BFD97|nr:4'-phosphopantetheinyl transferase superfamily protein [Yinghuangia seranimata]MDI2127673.1 4'-phosphopantetheinyl transferase superfamily protein [Yinghuangia seranimata]